MKTLFNHYTNLAATLMISSASIFLFSCTKDKKNNSNTNQQNQITWSRVDAGLYHAAAIKSDGTLWVWGDNSYHQLGDGSTTDKNKPTLINQDKDWTSVSTGRTMTFALKNNGTLWAWGKQGEVNTYAGDGSTTVKTTPTQIGTATDWMSVSTASTHTLALKRDGTLWAWGVNNNKQLGDNTTNNASSPIAIASDKRFKSVHAGDEFSLAIATDGTLWAWGSNLYGNLANGSFVHPGTGVPTQIGTENNWYSCAAAWGNSVAINNTGALFTWGHNNHGQLGNGTNSNAATIQALTLSDKIYYIDAMNFGCIAVGESGQLYVWGQFQNNTPTRVPTNLLFNTASVGLDFHLAISQDGKLYSWGSNRDGVLGIGANSGRYEELQEVK